MVANKEGICARHPRNLLQRTDGNLSQIFNDNVLHRDLCAFSGNANYLTLMSRFVTWITDATVVELFQLCISSSCNILAVVTLLLYCRVPAMWFYVN